MQTAERSSELFDTIEPDYEYYSSKYSPINDTDTTADKLGELEYKYAKYKPDTPENYRRMWLFSDTHFFNIHVNTTFSSVHVPTNVFDKRELIDFA